MYKNKGFGEAKPYAYYARIAEQVTKGDKKSQKLFNKLMREKDPLMNIAMSNHMQSIYDNYASQEGSTMIKSTDYEPMHCCLCGARMETIHDTHNPEPLTPRTYAKEALEKGSVIVFPSFHRHRVTPVTSGIRHSLVTWVEGPHWR